MNSLHETLHELYKNKMNGVILKLDFEKAYAKVCWDFLFENLKHKNFGSKCKIEFKMLSLGALFV